MDSYNNSIYAKILIIKHYKLQYEINFAGCKMILISIINCNEQEIILKKILPINYKI